MAKKRDGKMGKDSPNLVIVVAPDKTCLDEDGLIIPGTDVILISDPSMYFRMQAILSAWGKEEMGLEGKREEIIG